MSSYWGIVPFKGSGKALARLGQNYQGCYLLDTHYAHPEEATEQYEVGGKHFAYKKYGEGKDVFSGMYDHAKWLPLNSILEILNNQGFKHQEVLEKRDERNDPRVLLYLARNK